MLVNLRYERTYIFNNLKECNFCNFTLLMPPYLGFLALSPRSPPFLHATDLAAVLLAQTFILSSQLIIYKAHV